MKDNKKRPHTEALIRYLRREYLLGALAWGVFVSAPMALLASFSSSVALFTGFVTVMTFVLMGFIASGSAIERLRLEAWRQETIASGKSFEEEKFTAVNGCTSLYVSEHWLQYIDRHTLRLYFLADVQTISAVGGQMLTLTFQNGKAPQNIKARNADARTVAAALSQRLFEIQTQEERVCRSCGYVNEAQAHYCGNCGAPLEEK